LNWSLLCLRRFLLAFAGIGLMGLPMTQRLARLSADGRRSSQKKCTTLQAQGAQVVSHPAELCAGAEIVMLCLANTEAVREVVFGPGVSLSKAGLGRCWWIFSSLEPTATREMAAELEARCAVCVGSMLQCPGGTPGAQQGSLVIMAGGAPADIERCAQFWRTWASA
jgi:3-hydroxyisobutyrate dehydrogenase